nr:type VI secretion system domain-containing protein [Granulicella aggregans]
MAEQDIRRRGEDPEEGSPPSEVRLSLRRTMEAGDWESLARQALKALAMPMGTPWLDLYRYLDTATASLGAEQLREVTLHLLRGQFGAQPWIREASFEDGTPAADRETNVWIDAEVMPKPTPDATRPEPVLQTVEHQPSPIVHEDDLHERASELARQGNFSDAAHSLMKDVSALKSGRGSFLRRMEISRLLLHSGQHFAAQVILRHLLTEADERKIEGWEESSMLAELLSMLLQSATGDANETQRLEVFLRLCRIDPATALNAQSLV